MKFKHKNINARSDITRGFTLVEIMISLSITSLAMLSLMSSLNSLQKTQFTSGAMQDFDTLVGMVNTAISNNDRCSLLLTGNLPSSTISISTDSGDITSIPLYSNSSGTVLAGQGVSFGNHLSSTTVLLKITGSGVTPQFGNPTYTTYPAELSMSATKAYIQSTSLQQGYGSQTLQTNPSSPTRLFINIDNSSSTLIGCTGTQVQNMNDRPIAMPSCKPSEAMTSDGKNLYCIKVACNPPQRPVTFNSSTGVDCSTNIVTSMTYRGITIPSFPYYDASTSQWKNGLLGCPKAYTPKTLDSGGYVSSCIGYTQASCSSGVWQGCTTTSDPNAGNINVWQCNASYSQVCPTCPTQTGKCYLRNDSSGKTFSACTSAGGILDTLNGAVYCKFSSGFSTNWPSCPSGWTGAAVRFNSLTIQAATIKVTGDASWNCCDTYYSDGYTWYTGVYYTSTNTVKNIIASAHLDTSYSSNQTYTNYSDVMDSFAAEHYTYLTSVECYGRYKDYDRGDGCKKGTSIYGQCSYGCFTHKIGGINYGYGIDTVSPAPKTYSFTGNVWCY